MHARAAAILVVLVGLAAAVTACGSVEPGPAARPPGTSRVILTTLPTGMTVAGILEELDAADDRPVFVKGADDETIVVDLTDATELDLYGNERVSLPGTPEVVGVANQGVVTALARTLPCGVAVTTAPAPARRDAALAILRSARCSSPTALEADAPPGYRHLGASIPERTTAINLRDTEGRPLEIFVLDLRNPGDDILSSRVVLDGRTRQVNGFPVERGHPPAPADSTPRTTWVVHVTQRTMVTLTHNREESGFTDDMIRDVIAGMRLVSEDEWNVWRRPPGEPGDASGPDGPSGSGGPRGTIPVSPTGATAGAPLTPSTSVPACNVGAVDPAPELRLWPTTKHPTARVTVMVHGPNCGSLTTITITTPDVVPARTRFVSLQTRVNAAAEASVLYPPGAVPQTTLAGTREVTFAATAGGPNGITEVRGSFVEAGHVVAFASGNLSVAEVLAVIADLRVATDKEWREAQV